MSLAENEYDEVTLSVSGSSESSLQQGDHDTEVSEVDNDEPLPFITSDAPPPPVMERRLAREMAMLSMHERNELLNEIHGVSEIPQEKPEFISKCLSEMEQCLQELSMEEQEPYALALAQNADYVTNRAFRLMFLRAETYDPFASAERLMLHLKVKMKLFGSRKLTKEIGLEDMDYGDLYTIHSGYIQPQPFCDTAGRKVVLIRVPLMKFYALENVMRTLWYFGMQWARDEHVQLHGFVCVGDNDCYQSEKDLTHMQATGIVRHAIPATPKANHFIMTNPDDVPAISIIPYFMERTQRLRFRSHLAKSNKDIMETLATFGITLAPFVLPRSNERGLVVQSEMHQLQDFIRRRRNQLQLRSEPESDLEGSNEVSEGGTSRKRKKSVVQKLGSSTHSVSESEDDDVRSKGSRSNVSRSREVVSDDGDSISNTSDILTPRPEDVVLGYGANRDHPGTKYLHQLISERLEDYRDATRAEKGAITNEISKAIRDRGGRFLKRNDDDFEIFGEGSSVRREWEEADRTAERKKISNLFIRLRDKGSIG